MTSPVACMGGWCAKREACAHYHAQDRRYPIERLCGAHDEPEPIRVVESPDQEPERTEA